MKRIISIFICIVLVLSAVLTMSSCGKKEDPNSFTVLIVKNEDSTYYSNYSQNPIALYTTTQKEYLGEKIDVQYVGLVSGSEKDQFNTMISTGEYYDMMPLSYSDYTAKALYDQGVALDLTDLVKQYMPNYLKFLDETPALQRVAYSVDENGNKKIYQLWSATDEPQDNFQGFLYRRDWIVKYGANPSTGEKFTGGYGEDGVWTDDVKFPSWYDESNKYAVAYKERHPDWDGTDPVFISDWEWMFGIFDKARAALNITDGYDVSITYAVTNACGDGYSGFGGTAPMWYYNVETGKVDFDATSEHMQAYLECMSTWYKNGWLDKEFDTRASDMFYAIDSKTVRAGKVGLWQGRRADLNGQIDDATTENPLTDGIYACGAKQPINDIYGSESSKGKEPIASYQFDYPDSSYIITAGAEKKNIGVFLTYLDSFYEIGGDNTLAKNLGLSKEQFAAIREYQEEINGKAVQERFEGLENGCYFELPAGSNQLYEKVAVMQDDTYLNNAMVGLRMFGLGMHKDIKSIADDMYDSIVNKWGYYDNSAYIQQYINKLMSADDSKLYAKINNNIDTKMKRELPKFVKGEYDIYGEDWDTYVKTINKMGAEKVTAIYNEIYGRFE